LRRGYTAKLRDFGVILQKERKDPLECGNLEESAGKGGNLLMLSNVY